MRFEKEINIYGDEAILRRFQSNETSVSVLQGKISSLISESELEELENSHTTMYSKLASAILDIGSLTLNFSDLTTKYNTVSGQYTALDSQVAEYKAGVDGLEANVTAVQQNLSQNYSTTTAMNAAISAKANEISAELSAVQTTLENDYSTTTAMNAAINAKANEISLSVSSQIAAINGDITQMSAAITTNAENIALRVAKGEVISEINQSSDTITLNSNRLVVNSENFKLTKEGNITASNATLDGVSIEEGNIYISGQRTLNYGGNTVSGTVFSSIASGSMDIKTLTLKGDNIPNRYRCTGGITLSDNYECGVQIDGYGIRTYNGNERTMWLNSSNGAIGGLSYLSVINSDGSVAFSVNSKEGSYEDFVYSGTNIECPSLTSREVPHTYSRNDSNGMGQQGRLVSTDLNHYVCFEWITYMGTSWLNGFVDITSLGGVQFQ